MKTAHKIALAKAAYHCIHAGRTMLGKNDKTIVRRRGSTFELDLAEGIDFAIYLLGAFEPATLRAIQKWSTPGRLALDIGANVGAHTLHLAQLVGPTGKVLAFEPTDYAMSKLRRNIELNPEIASRIVTHKCFLGASDDTSAPALIYSSWPLTATDSLHDKHLGRAMAAEATPQRQLDAVLGTEVNNVAFVKMDVDGHECSVLKGASKVLSMSKPVFVMELAPYSLEENGGSLEELLGYFSPHGYKFLDERSEEPIGEDPGAIARAIGEGASKNVIAVPPQRNR